MKKISWKEFREMWNKGTIQEKDYRIVSNRGHDVVPCLVTWKDSFNYSYPIFGSKTEDLVKADMNSDVYILYQSGPSGGFGSSMVKLKNLKVEIWD